MQRGVIGASIVLAATLGAAVEAGALQIVNEGSMGAFMDVPALGGEALQLGDDGETGIGSFSGNFVFQPGLIVVGFNGGLSFAKTVTDLAPENEEIPSAAAFLGGQAALVYWDDIDDKEGDIYTIQVGGMTIVQWNWTNFDGKGSTLKAQAQIFANPNPTGIYAQFLYEIEGAASGAGASATIGYQDGGAGSGDVQFSFDTPNAVVDGTVLSLVIVDCPEEACPIDLDCDGRIGFGDLLTVVSTWGPCRACPADLDGSGAVDFADVLLVLDTWGPCPG